MYSKILVPLDGSEMAECVLPHVETIAAGCGVGSITLVQAVEPVRPVVVGYDLDYSVGAEDWAKIEDDISSAADKYLKDLAEKTKISGASIQYEVVRGRAADTVAEYAEKNGFDLIAIATHGRSGFSRWVLGSVAEKLVRTSNVPVLMVRAPECRIER